MEIKSQIKHLQTPYFRQNSMKNIEKQNFSVECDDVADKSINQARANYAIATINIKSENVLSKLKSFLTEIVAPNEYLHNERIDKKNIIRINAGKEIKGFNNLYQTDKSICCYLDNDNELESIYILNHQNDNIDVYNIKNKKEAHFNKNEIKALTYYKNHPQWIHSKLRFDKNQCSGSFLNELEQVLQTLDNIFQDKEKLNTNKETKILYRALQSNISSDDIEQLQTIGGLFTEKSYCSTTTDLSVAKRFKHNNPILEIEFPKDAKYIDIEKLTNIDREHYRESEYLLDKNSQFLVTGFNPEENIIKVKYIML